MVNVLQIVRHAMGYDYYRVQRGQAHMTNKAAKQYVTIGTVVAANAKMVGQTPAAPQPRTADSIARPEPPSREALAEAGSRALQSLKSAR